jgi:hypothetical protein
MRRSRTPAVGHPLPPANGKFSSYYASSLIAPGRPRCSRTPPTDGLLVLDLREQVRERLAVAHRPVGTAVGLIWMLSVAMVHSQPGAISPARRRDTKTEDFRLVVALAGDLAEAGGGKQFALVRAFIDGMSNKPLLGWTLSEKVTFSVPAASSPITASAWVSTHAGSTGTAMTDFGRVAEVVISHGGASPIGSLGSWRSQLSNPISDNSPTWSWKTNPGAARV